MNLSVTLRTRYYKNKKMECLVSDYLLASGLIRFLLVVAVEVVAMVVVVGVLTGVVVAGTDC